MSSEIYREGPLELKIDLDLNRQGWVVVLTTPPLWVLGQKCMIQETVRSEIVIPFATYEQGDIDEYLDALLAIHYDHLGLLQSGW